MSEDHTSQGPASATGGPSGGDAHNLVLARKIVEAASARKLSIATAESLTAGLVSATLAAIPGASATLQGGVVAYSNRVKNALLGVDAALLEREGSVHPEVAGAMAAGACFKFDADVAVSTTGVAGPSAHDGKEVGVVYIGIAWWVTQEVSVKAFKFEGDRDQIRVASVKAALSLLAEKLDIIS